jgi:hypothetical protein
MLKFDKVSHSYKNVHTNQEYISATSLINKFKKKFDADFHAKRVADKEGVTPEVIKERWKAINTESKVKGSNTHEAIDAFNKSGIIDKKYEVLLLSLKALDLYDREKSKCEELVYNHQYKIAGTADCIEDCGSTFNVYDFKTNKKFNLFSAYNTPLLAPISHLSECEYNIYSLQLSLYAFMFSTMTGKNVGKLAAIHIDIDNKLSVYNTPYLYSDILKMLTYGKN